MPVGLQGQSCRNFGNGWPRVAVWTATIVAASIWTVPAGAFGSRLRLDLTEALRRARVANPGVLAQQAEIADAEIELRRASAWFPSNPYVSTGLSRRSETGGRPNLFFFLSQEVEVAGQRKFRVGQARHWREREKWSLRHTEGTLEASVRRAFVGCLAAAERLTLVTRAVELSSGGVRQGSRRSGDPDGNYERARQTRSQMALVAAETAREQSHDNLLLLVDLPLDTELELTGSLPTRAPSLPSLVDLVARAFEDRGDLKSFAAAVEAAEERLATARREGIPNLNLSGSYSRFDKDDFLGGDVGMFLPVFRRNGPNVEGAALQLERSRLQLRSLRRDVEADVRAARREFRAAAVTSDALRRVLLPMAEENVAAWEAAGSASADVETQIEMLRLRQEVLDAVERLNLAWIDLERSIGGPLQPADPKADR